MVTNSTMAKAMCACLLARGVQAWSTEAVGGRAVPTNQEW
jgi:hypothetical protein